MAIKVLIVEDDSNIAQLLQLYLEKEGFETQVAADGGQGVTLFHSFAPDLVLLDIMLPVLDGWGVCRKIRETDKTPIIMMTAKGELEDKVSGLEMGADDYIVKPFEMKEVMARIHAVLRRYGGDQGGRKKLTFDKLVINMDSYELLVDGKRVDTPPKERWSCSITWPPRPTGSLPGTSCWMRCGALTTSGIPGRWTYISSACGRSWKECPTSGASRPCGA